MNKPSKSKAESVYGRMASEFKVGEIFDGSLLHWCERKTVKPIWEVKGEILEIKPTGLCVDDGKGDELFVAFSTIAKHRAQAERDYRFDMDMILSTP